MQGAAIPTGVFLPTVSPRENPRSDRAMEEAAGRARGVQCLPGTATTSSGPCRGASPDRFPVEKNSGGNRLPGQNDGEGKAKSEKSLCRNVFRLCIALKTKVLSGTFRCRFVSRLTKSACRIIIAF